MFTEFEFTIFVLAIAGLINFLHRPMSEAAESRRFKREKAKFRQQIENGIRSNKPPMHMAYNGGFRIDAEDFIETENFRKLLKNTKK